MTLLYHLLALEILLGAAVHEEQPIRTYNSAMLHRASKTQIRVLLGPQVVLALTYTR